MSRLVQPLPIIPLISLDKTVNRFAIVLLISGLASSRRKRFVFKRANQSDIISGALTSRRFAFLNLKRSVKTRSLQVVTVA